MSEQKNGSSWCKPVGFERILLPVSGSKADGEAIRIACMLAKKSKGKVYAVYVIRVKRALPVDAELEAELSRGEEVLDQAERLAGEEDYELESDILQAREVGPAIIDEAVQKNIDLILMGINYVKRFGEFSLGDVVPYVLKDAPCRVMLYRELSP